MRRLVTRFKLVGFGLCVAAFIAGCTLTPPPLPTVSSIEGGQTAQYLTQVAPPTGFEQAVSFPKIDNNLVNQPAWHYLVTLTFDGVFSGTNDKATSRITADVYSNELAGERRVLLSAAGNALGLTNDRNVEGVRIGNDYYQVDANKVCSKIDNPSPGQVADLAANSMIGGVKRATPAGQRRTDREVTVWEYTFSPDDVTLPTLQLSPDSTVTIAAGDLWVAPIYSAVWQYTLTLNVDKALMQQGAKAVTGQLRVNYQLVDAGKQFSIAIPFGC